jgi:hypothetical protein
MPSRAAEIASAASGYENPFGNFSFRLVRIKLMQLPTLAVYPPRSQCASFQDRLRFDSGIVQFERRFNLAGNPIDAGDATWTVIRLLNKVKGDGGAGLRPAPLPPLHRVVHATISASLMTCRFSRSSQRKWSPLHPNVICAAPRPTLSAYRASDFNQRPPARNVTGPLRPCCAFCYGLSP